MNNGSYQGMPLEYADGRNTNVIFVPEHLPHYYSAGKLQVVAVGFDSNGAQPEDPPDEYKAPNFNRATGSMNWPEPHAGYRLDGSVGKSGYIPTEKGKAPVFVIASPARELSDAEAAAKRFHDALADPSSLVATKGPEKAGLFIEEVLAAVQKLTA